MKDIRRVVVSLVIGCFSIAALLGIATLLGASPFGEGQSRVLVTTAVIGIESLAMLCYLSLAGHRLAAVGVVGALASFVATGTALAIIWADNGFDSGDLFRQLGLAVTIAATLAQASMLLALCRRSGLVPLLTTTLGIAGLLATLICFVIITEQGGEGLAKTIGVLAILDVLGTLVMIALGVFGGRPDAPARPSPSAPMTLTLDAALSARVLGLAAARRTSPALLVAKALDALESSDVESSL